MDVPRAAVSQGGGGGGAGIYCFFIPNISLLAGPVWFSGKGTNGKMKWTTQLDADF